MIIICTPVKYTPEYVTQHKLDGSVVYILTQLKCTTAKLLSDTQLEIGVKFDYTFPGVIYGGITPINQIAPRMYECSVEYEEQI